MKSHSQTILITGCSRGLGKFLAEFFADKDWVVYAGIRRPEDIKQLKFVWKESHPSIYPIKLDITEEKDCQRVVKKIVANKEQIDVLINNAAYSLTGPTADFTPKEYLDILDTNTVGAFRLIREVVPQMRSQENGRIINITSLNGIIALPNSGLYCSSKFALEALGFAMRYELKKDGVWVTNIAPGAITSERKSVKRNSHLSARKRFWLINKLMPMVTQEKVARAVERVIKDPKPPVRVILGRDTQIITFLQRFLPQRLWDFLISFIWQR
ncbi:SDR family oxidoreductase [Patescibacteria group bacterium]|nr:SDR family oxidoreductase [Patescibacteria group bacterium]